MFKKITLLRHAPVKKRYLNSFNGWIDIDIEIAYNDKKINNLKKILRNNNFDRIYSSDLIRCKNTLKLLEFEKFEVMKEFREIAFKDFAEGKNFDDIQKSVKIPDNAFDNIERWSDFIAKESYEEFIKRIKRGIEKTEGKNILLCTHGGVIAVFAHLYLNQNLFSKKINYLDLLVINDSLKQY